MWTNLLSRFRKETLKTHIPFYESLLHGKIGSMQIDHNSGLENYKQTENPHPDVLAAYPQHLKSYQLNFDVLETAKRKLSQPDYYSLLQALMWYRFQVYTRFMEWRDFYSDIPSRYPPTYWLFVRPASFFDCALRTPFGASHTLPNTIPDSLYMHHEISGYPKTDEEALVKILSGGKDPSSDRQAKKIRKKLVQMEAATEKSNPFFYGQVDKIYGIQYEARSAHLPTGGIIEDIRTYYEQHGWRPLEYDLIYPYCKGGLSNGWNEGHIWSQFWINDADDVVCVNLYIGPTELGELNVFVLCCPNEYAKESLAYYRRFHSETETVSENMQIPDYEHFKVYPIPPFDYNLSPQILDYFSKIRPK